MSTGHRILWMNGILHKDISPSNLMVYKNANNEWIGVLNDYDLSSTQQDGPSGNERTGTIPFMAIDLLEDVAIEGKVQHLYQHDAESLIWVLAWVCLRYEDGKLRRNRPFNGWLKADAKQCRQEKNDFLISGRRRAQPSPSHEAAWDVAQSCLVHVGSLYLARRKPTLEDEYVYSTWLEAEVNHDSKTSS
jgi:serine/threonine protein kinase